LIGLTREKAKARIAIAACLQSGETFPHTLLLGIGGTGKTAFARAIGSELKCHFVETHGAAYKRPDQLLTALVHYSQEAKRANKPLFFFVDEVHRLKTPLQEALYSVMKEWWIPTETGRIEVAPFTLIAATTRFDMLDANSFVTRFAQRWEIQRYSASDIRAIVARQFIKKGLRCKCEVIVDIAKRCLGVPRIAINLAENIRRAALAAGTQRVTLAHIHQVFDLEEIDELGLHPVHRKYLGILLRSEVDGKHTPLGVGPIAAKMRQPEEAVKGSVEPILLELDFVAPTPRGRMLTAAGLAYLEKVEKRA
jgi:Holliday junction DNA helicase RuvB